MTDETKPTYRYTHENCPKCNGTGDSLDECTYYKGKVCSSCGFIWGYEDQRLAVPYKPTKRTGKQETEYNLNEFLRSARNFLTHYKVGTNKVLDLAEPLVRELGLESDEALRKYINNLRAGIYPETLYQIPTTWR